MNVGIRSRHSAPEDAAHHRERALALLPELADRPVPHRRVHHRLTIVLAGVASLALVAAVFGGFWGYLWWQKEVGQQHPPAAPAFDGATAAAFHAAAAAADGAPAGTGAAPIVLTYHDIAPGGDSHYVVSPAQFSAQMAMLHDAGYHSLTAEDFLRYQSTGKVPPRSVLITFDDGTRGLWTYADPVLDRYGFTAVAFLITASVGEHEPYYLTWPQVGRMAASGRWDFGSHTDGLHTKISGGEGSQVPVLTARPPVDRQPETLDAFRGAVRSDLQRSLREFAAHDLPRPQLFAWPFSGIVGKQPDPAAAAVAEQEVSRAFRVAFVNVFRPRPATLRDVRSGRVQRLELVADDTAPVLFQRMREMETLPVRDLRLANGDALWLEQGGHTAPLDPARLKGGVLVPEARSLRYLQAYWEPQRTSEWRRYQLSGTITPSPQGGTSGLTVHGQDRDQQVSVRVSSKVASVLSGGKVVANRIFSDAGDVQPTHAVKVVVTGKATTVVVDGRPLARVTGAGAPGGVGLVFGRDSTRSGWGSIHDLRVRPVE